MENAWVFHSREKGRWFVPIPVSDIAFGEMFVSQMGAIVSFEAGVPAR